FFFFFCSFVEVVGVGVDVVDSSRGPIPRRGSDAICRMRRRNGEAEVRDEDVVAEERQVGEERVLGQIARLFTTTTTTTTTTSSSSSSSSSSLSSCSLSWRLRRWWWWGVHNVLLQKLTKGQDLLPPAGVHVAAADLDGDQTTATK